MGQGQSPDRTQAGPDDQGQGQGPAVSPGAGPQKGQPGAGPAKQKKKKLVRDKNGKWIEVDEGDTGGDDSGSN
jgi:hypothetical protein